MKLNLHCSVIVNLWCVVDGSNANSHAFKVCDQNIQKGGEFK